MSIYIGNNLENRLKILEIENASLKKYNDYHLLVHEIDHMSDLLVDCSFYKQSMKFDNYFKIKEWIENYMKDLKESVCHGAVVSVLDVGYTVLGKT